LAAVAALITVACSGGGSAPTAESAQVAGAERANVNPQQTEPVECEVFAPGDGDQAGVNGIGWFVDLDCEFPGFLRTTGFTGNQLTGPGVHNNAPPFPGNFAPGKDERFAGLITLISTTTIGAKSCQNLSNLFNITGPTNVADDGTEIWDTWIISAPNFGRNVRSILWVAEAADLNHDGVYNDAPDVVPDANHDGRCDATDLAAFGLASEVTTVHFFIR
jgi:hypothetical protein